MSDEEFRSKMHDSVKEFLEDSPFDEEQWTGFAKSLHYIAGDLSDPALYTAIKEKLTALGRTNVLYYLSTQPSYYGEVAERFGRRGIGPQPRARLAAHRGRKTVSATIWTARAN